MKEKVNFENVVIKNLTNRDFVESFCHIIDMVFGEEKRKKEWDLLIKNTTMSEYDKNIMEERIFAKPNFHYSIFNKFNFCENPDIFVDLKQSKKEKLEIILNLFYKEAVNKGLNTKINNQIANNRQFIEWCENMENNPTYISEVLANNRWGNCDFDFAYDPAVRKASNLLKQKGYHTYWSSANVKDTERERFGVLVPNKNVAFILIDPKNLPENLKKSLFISNSDRLWGSALEHRDKNGYYGIWTELEKSPKKELCESVSKKLEEQADCLPILTNTKDKKVECYREL
ncbi:MAG: hypothetical protein PHQ62_04025 [Clostridia bacterium]|nr:hypothetical protein [Clostridia bacterium]